MVENIKKEKDIVVNNVNPLAELHFGRDEFAQKLEGVIKNLDDSFVISLDSAWGTGKSFFFKRFKEYLILEEYCVLEYNVWENDDERDPFIPLISEITKQFQEYVGSNTIVMKNILISAAKIATKGLPLLVKLLVERYLGQNGLEKLNEGMKDALKDAIQSGSESMSEFSVQQIEEFGKDKKNKEIFKQSLEKFRKHVAKKHKNQIVVLVDELDRCKPDYAIEFLERIKHLFDVDGFIFILGIDRKQLVNSIKQIYGQNIDDLGYLKRFFDFEFRLPEMKTSEYIELKIKELPVTYNTEKKAMLKIFGKCADAYGLSLREIKKNWLNLKMIAASIDNVENILNIIVLPFMFVLRYKHLDEYEKFIKGIINKEKVQNLNKMIQKFITENDKISISIEHNFNEKLFPNSSSMKNILDFILEGNFGNIPNDATTKKEYNVKVEGSFIKIDFGYRNITVDEWPQKVSCIFARENPFLWSYKKLELLKLVIDDD